MLPLAKTTPPKLALLAKIFSKRKLPNVLYVTTSFSTDTLLASTNSTLESSQPMNASTTPPL